ncbi:MAG: DnaA N-terminal domain-containing protein, partial [Atribacterota bacterium]|nr:DnaA N-terminal domain-containing protein [Atribacterota bacterium]
MSYSKLNNKWDEILKIMQENLTPQIYNTWFSGLKFVEFKNNELILTVPHLFCKNWLEKNYYQFLKEIITEQAEFNDDDLLIKFQVDINNTQIKGKNSKENNKQEDLQKKYNKTGLNTAYTFK